MYHSTDSDDDYEAMFNSRLIGVIQKDYSRLNLKLLKGVIGKPSVKQGQASDTNIEDELPMALEEKLLRQKIIIENEIEAQ